MPNLADERKQQDKGVKDQYIYCKCELDTKPKLNTKNDPLVRLPSYNTYIKKIQKKVKDQFNVKENR